MATKVRGLPGLKNTTDTVLNNIRKVGELVLLLLELLV
jgi:hypothetical protein